MKRRSVIYAPEAADDLDWIYGTIAAAASPVVAEGYDLRIRTFCESLEYGAERGSLRTDIRPGLRVIGFERRVAVAFLVEPDRVVILRILYGGADLGL
ncbi:type II toxin-antitoxin system RelE/ParE family toxin [Jiella mangrovi]|uniref:Type II toxin-antitoxin system RelE/ParE family toxin n=1 Tax=Jiella mangrovi TaxID=2821407 RepID=A0ABS4BFQ4_9HYPH|nr:type II toxin-antitoxin system RelE/ParE family toxin [Jiella mangrovi]